MPGKTARSGPQRHSGRLEWLQPAVPQIWPSSQFGLRLPSKPVRGSSGESYCPPVAEEVRAVIMSSRQWPPNTRIERCYAKNNKQVRKAEGS